MSVNVLKRTSRLPNEYQEVEYIQSSGAQYIDTGISPTNTTGMKVTFSDLYIEGSDFNFIGCRIRSSSRFMINYVNGNFGYGWNSFYATNTTLDASVKYTAELNFRNDRTFKVDGVTVASLSTISLSGMPNIGLFAQITNDGVDYHLYKLYNVQISEGNSLVRNFVPCYRKSDNVIGMYDLVNGVFYTNAGTGTFLKGDMVVSYELQKMKVNLLKPAQRLPNEYQEVEYIQGSGTQYIDTGIGLSSFDIIKSKFEITASTSSMKDAIYGSYNANFFVLLMRSPSQARVGTSSNQASSTNYELNKIYDTSLANGTYIENGTTYTFTPHTGFTNLPSCYIMSRKQSGAFPVSAKVYSFEIVGKFNGIPCYRKADGVIGLYDTVSETFFTNAGTGTFLKGDNVSTTVIQPVKINILKKTDNLLKTNRNNWNTTSYQPADAVVFDYDKLYYMTGSGYIRANPGTLNETITNKYVTYTQTSSSWWGIGFPFEVKPNTKYTISAKRDDGDKTKIMYALYDADGSFKSYAQLTTNTSILDISLTITTGANTKTMVIVVAGITQGNTVYAYDLQVEEGQTRTVFKPYGYEITKI